MGAWTKVLAVATAALAALVFLVERNAGSFYVFELDHLRDVSTRGIQAHGNDTRAVVRYIVDELRERPRTSKHLNLDEEWIFNNAGGAMGGMWMVHVSITEYLLIFGTAIGTEGHTGRHTADDYFHILQGEQWVYKPGDYEPEIYRQGSMHHLVRGEVKQYKMPEGCFALEYARGWIPPMMLFGLADGFTSTLDLPTLWRTVVVTLREMGGNLLRGKI